MTALADCLAITPTTTAIAVVAAKGADLTSLMGQMQQSIRDLQTVVRQVVALHPGSVTLAANSTWTTSTRTITMNVVNPGTVIAGMGVYDNTASQSIGTVSSYNGKTLILTANASHGSSGSTDSLIFNQSDVANLTALNNLLAELA
jgi:hypothetical protein